MPNPRAGPHPFGIASLDGLIARRQPYDLVVSLTLPRSPSNLGRGNFMIALHLLSQGDPATSSAKAHPHPPPVPYYLPGRSALTTTTSTKSTKTDDDPLSLLQPTRLNLPSFLSTNAILFTTTRPALIPYIDPFAELAARLLFLPYHLLSSRPVTATVRLEVPMAEDLVFAGARGSSSLAAPYSAVLPERLLLEVQAGQDLQVYEASVKVVARLKGLMGLMYRWKVTAFVVFTGMFWAGEMVALGTVAVMILGWDLGGLLAGGAGGDGEGRDGRGDEDEDDSDRYGGDRGRLKKVEASETEGSVWKAASKGEPWSSSSSIQRLASPSSPSSGLKKEEEDIKEEEEGNDTESDLYKVPPFEGPSGGSEGEGKGKAKEEGEESQAHDVGVGTSYKASEGSARKRTITPGSQEESE
jgi:seipin